MTTTESILIPAVALFALLSTILVFLLYKTISKAKVYKNLYHYLREANRNSSEKKWREKLAQWAGKRRPPNEPADPDFRTSKTPHNPNTPTVSLHNTKPFKLSGAQPVIVPFDPSALHFPISTKKNADDSGWFLRSIIEININGKQTFISVESAKRTEYSDFLYWCAFMETLANLAESMKGNEFTDKEQSTTQHPQ